jgi:hypothetical protein
MAATVRHTLRVAAAVFALAALSGCATRFDPSGNRIYVWQFGQDTSRGIDYTNPRLPVLPRQPPNFNLWEIPSPYEFNDLSRYSFLAPQSPLTTTMIAVSDNAGCAATCEPKTLVALAAVDAGSRGIGRSSAGR